MKPIPVKHIAAHGAGETAGQFNIREVKAILAEKDVAQPQHRHDFFFVLAIEKGRGSHEIDFSKYNVCDSSIFILRPGQVHQLQLRGESTGYLMEFDVAFYQPQSTVAYHRWKKASSKNYCELEAGRFARMQSLLKTIFDEYTNRQFGYVEAIKANLDLFFLEYVRQSRSPHKRSKGESNYTLERFEEFAGLLETKVSELKSASQYAELLNLSSYQLNAITKASVGKTVSDLINEQIILEAKRNLTATANQIKDVADQLGYEDASYFIRFFRKQTGLTPEEFRKNFK